MPCMQSKTNCESDSNGPIFMPNSRLMQQMLRFDFERYQEEIGDGKSLLDPSVVCIQRGMTLYNLTIKELETHWFRHSNPPCAGVVEGRHFSLFPAAFASYGS
jgi:hypothetical protein